MPLSTIRVTPNMSYAQLVAAVNENFALVENINRTQIFKDETGTQRIILGRLPDGTWGLIISRPGEDVVKLFEGN